MKHLKIAQSGHCLTITISRIDAMNALNVELLNELRVAVKQALDEISIKGVIITGDGEKAFVAGADIKELSSLSEADAFKLSQSGQQLFASIENASKPFIAAIDGFALGGGCELAMACHMRIATENSKFGQPEVNLGIIPGYGATQRLTQLVGRGKALELMLTGEMISAQEAKSLGLVNHVVANKPELLALASKIIEKIASKGPVAVSYLIKTVNAGFSFETQGYNTESKYFAACTTSDDFREGTSAFIEKRKPQFKGK